MGSANDDSVFAFDAGHVATASGKIFYCHSSRGICVVEQLILTSPYVAQMQLRQIQHNQLQVDNFRRLDFDEFYRLGFNVEYEFLDEFDEKFEDDVGMEDIDWPDSERNDEDDAEIDEPPLNESMPVEYDDLSTYEQQITVDSSPPPKTKRANKRYSKSGPQQCRICGWRFENQHKLSAHMKAHCTQKNHPCELCHKAFSWKCDLTKHLLNHHSASERCLLAPDASQPFQCGDCGITCNTRAALVAHQKGRAHGPYDVASNPNSSHLNASIHDCNLCGELFDSKEQLKQHQKEMHPNVELSCSHCSFATKQSHRLQEHLLEKHQIGGKPNAKPYKCLACSAEFVASHQLKHHLATRHGNEQVDYMWWGVRRCGQFNGFECNLCSRVFPSKYKLSTHTRTHTNERPFGCETCNKRFRFKQDVQRHKVIHTGAKDFECPECSKRFRDKTGRDAHVRIYHKKQDWTTVFKAHKCKQCGTKVRNLKYHILRAHTSPSKWPFPCPSCSYRAPIRSELVQHTIQKHTHDWPHKCKICTFGCMGKPQMNKHMLNHDNGRTILERDDDGEIKIQLENGGFSDAQTSGIDLLDQAESAELAEGKASAAVENEMENRYDPRLFRDALKDFIGNKMRIVDIVELYGIGRNTLNTARIRLNSLHRLNPHLSTDEIISTIESPLRQNKLKLNPQIINEAIEQIGQGKMSIDEAAEVYEIKKSTLNQRCRKMGIGIESNVGNQRFSTRIRKRSKIAENEEFVD